ncbi:MULTISPECIES: energy transducer TonB [unclassified Dyella]|uniref:energy transducer TonB n=1 Tax=unclassified Dyella TaxID=2634549 RepID=UPI000C820793|nr:MULTISPECIES: energy transducer TonB [unclassified Dyella]MDR3443906.1 energy transducer TonB [Dyella sp.]PMQ05179.1 hypothetical protein DyAD56_10935 [Dyella sp. AD56]
MFRLRTTVSLSLLALAIGVAGTAWLSTLTGDWAGPPGTPASRTDKVRMMLRRHSRPPAPSGHVAVATSAPLRPEETQPMLTPVEMPPLAASWLQRTAFASGRVVLQLTVDGDGRVDHAAVGESSGNAELDERALRTVARWRFAVPGDHPDGLSGRLVMRFDDTPAPSR